MYGFASVTEFVKYVQTVFDNDDKISNMSVKGEISGFKRYANSGHCYFSLKDKDSTVNCVMYNWYANNLGFSPEDGMLVNVVGNAGIYNQNGRFQIYCTHMSKIGKGDLRENYKLLFKKLGDEGLFDPSHKKNIPVMPKKIGVISSGSGAVIHDIIRTLKRRNPFFDLTLYPSAVQGDGAPKELISGLDYFESCEDRPDVVIIARGGGSFEDLFCFNDEALARRIYDFSIPVISGVGHEVDYTICDYVSDLRVPTPTAAAEVVLPKYEDLSYRLMLLDNDLYNSVLGYIDSQKKRLDALRNHKALSGPEYQLQNEMKRVKDLYEKLNYLETSRIDREKASLLYNMDRIELMSPLNVLKRGYSITFDDKGKTLRSDKVKTGDKIKIKTSVADIDATVDLVTLKGESDG